MEIIGMEYIIALAALLFSVMLADVNETVQTTLFGGVLKPENESEADRPQLEWENLRELCRIQGEVRRIIVGFSVNEAARKLHLFFENTMTSLFLDPKEPGWKSDGERFGLALARATGEIISDAASFDNAMEYALTKPEQHMELVVVMTTYTKDDGTTVDYPHWSVNWFDIE